MEPTIIGIIGCGSISGAYLSGAARSCGEGDGLHGSHWSSGRIGSPQKNASMPS